MNIPKLYRDVGSDLDAGKTLAEAMTSAVERYCEPVQP